MSKRNEHGFALVIALSLMAFVLLLLLSIIALTKIESESAATAMKQTRAEQNAFLALNVAIGQLQKYVGPDQRTTARADLEHGANASNSHWLGTYGSSIAADYTTPPETIAAELSDLSNISSKGSPARLLNWLVSGNETAAFNPSWTSGDVGSRGQITNYPATTAALNFRPDSAIVNGLTASTTATDTSITITDTSGTAQPARLLVGPNSVTSALDSSKPVDYVVAPTVDIESSGSTGDRYAWWVSDDGMKARINLPQAGTDSSLSSSEKLQQERNAFSNTERAAIELMAKDSASDGALDADRIDTLYTPDQSVTSLISTAQASLNSSDSDAMEEALKYRFHDITSQSMSVLSDTYAGGLKRDLSILLDESSNLTYAKDSNHQTWDQKTLWPRHSGIDAITDNATTDNFYTQDYGIPTWKHLRTYYQTRVPTSGPGTDKLDPILPANDKSNRVNGNTDGIEDHVGVAPILTYFSLGLSLGIDPIATNPSPDADAQAGDGIVLKLHPLVVLWNPYNFTINASEYEVGMAAMYNFQMNVYAIQTEEDPETGAYNPTGEPVRISKSLDLERLLRGTYEFTRFKLEAIEIPPGQSLIFTLPQITTKAEAYNRENLLVNAVPNANSYVTVPFRAESNVNDPLLIQAGEENYQYLLKAAEGSSGKNFRGSSGEFTMLLGEVTDPDTPLRAGHNLANRSEQKYMNPSYSISSENANARWYNTQQQIDFNNPKPSESGYIQDPSELYYDTSGSPVFVIMGHALFSGAGSNATFNTNQKMITSRWIAQGNIRATRAGRSMRDNNFNPLYTSTGGTTYETGVDWQKFNATGKRASAGSGHDTNDPSNPGDAILFEFPYEDQDLFSVGQLQHANLSFFSSYPAYPIGNSMADYRLPDGTGTHFSTLPEGYQIARIDRNLTSNEAIKGPMKNDMIAYYDVSYLLNRTLWDQYYFSTVPTTGSIPEQLPNTRYLRYNQPSDSTLRDPDVSASALMMEGGFNINSTSEQAWRAVLGGGNQLDFDPLSQSINESAAPDGVSFPRVSRPRSDDDPTEDIWKGYRTLNEDQIAQLARNIVIEIRNRGPFVTVADFVNRRLYDNPDTNDGSSSKGESWEHEQYKGPLQAAIDRTEQTADGEFAANDGSLDFWANVDALASNVEGDANINQSSQFTNVGFGYYDPAMFRGGDTATRPAGNRSIFAPKFITQADILAKIGAGLTARSDTFTIRTYGETVNPITQAVAGQAWCEAVVQRLPEYVDNSLEAYEVPADGSINQALGRKFKIISLKWLSASDI